MREISAFFNKILKNEKIVKNLEMLKGDIWWNLSFNERIGIFENIMEEISNFYPELGCPKFNFIVLDSNAKGEDSEEGTLINVTAIEEDNYYEILATCLHELRHFYQRKACEYYKEKGIVHELFASKEQLLEFKENLEKSPLFLNSNYIDYSPLFDNEYALQPIEYDAEKFACDFLKLFSKKFLKDKYDIKNCAFATLNFSELRKMFDNNENNVVEFDKIYKYNYQDNVKENRINFMKEKVVFDRYMNLLKRKDYIDNFHLFSLLNCCFYKTYDIETRVDLLNTYLRNSNSSSFIEYIDDGYYFNGLLFDVEEFDIYKIMEPLFLQIANDKVREIASKDMDELKLGFEREIKINLSKDENFIKQENNPLLYRLQPSVLFINGFVKNEYCSLVRAIDTAYSSYNSYFSDFEKYIRKYDNIPIVQKAEILMGKEFKEIYEDMISRMKNNLKKTLLK